jgi:soluble lytic murein transglycosylase-like protein
MLSRIHRANPYAALTRMQPGEWAVLARAYTRKTAKGILATAHHALLVLGVSAITALGMMFFNPNLADRLKALSPFAEAVMKPAVAAPPLTNLLEVPSPAVPEAGPAVAAINRQPSDADTSREQRWVTNWLSKRYHVAGDAANLLVSASYATAKDTKLDPLLILAVMSIESGLNPFAESAMGAQGLMQVMSKVHHDKFEDLGGVKAALNPVANIKVGSLILKDYVARGGSVEAGLKLYVGAAAFDNDAGYGSKVLAEYHRLKDVANGKFVPTFSAPIMGTVLKQHQQADDATAATPDSAAVDSKQMNAANQLAAM